MKNPTFYNDPNEILNPNNQPGMPPTEMGKNYDDGYDDDTHSAPDDDDDGDDGAGVTPAQTDQIFKTGSITTANGKHLLHCLTIIGQIEGHYILPSTNKTTKYEHVIPQLVAIEEDADIKGLIIILNTVGGDVEAGLAIAELISGMKKPTVSLVLGGGHSIGVPLAVSAKASFIAPTATMTIHPVRTSGLVLGVPQTLSYFDKMQERITKFVTGNSKITAEKFKSMMMNTDELTTDVGSVIDGQTAVDEGLIGNLGTLADALDNLYTQIDEKEPKSDESSKDEDDSK